MLWSFQSLLIIVNGMPISHNHQHNTHSLSSVTTVIVYVHSAAKGTRAGGGDWKGAWMGGRGEPGYTGGRGANGFSSPPTRPPRPLPCSLPGHPRHFSGLTQDDGIYIPGE